MDMYREPWFKWLAVTLVVGSVAFVLTPLWPVPRGAQPPDNLLPMFVALMLIESISFGLGVAFVIFGRPLLGRMGGPAGLTTAAYLAIAFLLLNWWPHDNMHHVTGFSWTGLVLVEYGFHLPLIVAGAVLAWFFVSLAQQRLAHA